MREIQPYYNILIHKIVCDVCKCHAIYEEPHFPKGWCTTREDHNNTICPDCNPWITHTINPDLEKLEKIK